MIYNYRALADKVAKANKDLYELKLVPEPLTFGNASARWENGFIIKPSGVKPSEFDYQRMVFVDLLSGQHKGNIRPSVDTPTHLELYNAFPEIGGIVHTHSYYATIFAQAEIPIPILGTTHADYFKSDIPLSESLTGHEIEGKGSSSYERNLGKRIIDKIGELGHSPLEIPAILMPNHGAYAWGRTIEQAVENAYVLEVVAKLAYGTIRLADSAFGKRMEKGSHALHLFQKHTQRKHGPDKYYGQPEGGSQ